MTASTRRWSVAASASFSFCRMLLTCFSTVPSVTQRLCADPGVRAALGHERQDLLLPRAQLREGVVTALGRDQLLHQCRIDDRTTRRRPSARCRRNRRRRRRGSSAGSRCRDLRRAASSRGPPRRAPRGQGSPMSGNSSRIAAAASRPSMVCVGGIRMSTSATSGTCSRTSSSSAVASPAWPTTSNPGRLRRLAMPARRRTSSSATTTRRAAPVVPTSGVLGSSAPSGMTSSMDPDGPAQHLPAGRYR